jgi:hypothetical protein
MEHTAFSKTIFVDAETRILSTGIQVESSIQNMMKERAPMEWKRSAAEASDKLTGLSDMAFLEIASFSSGKDMYNLSMSSSRFFDGYPSKPLLATRLLSIAMNVSLSGILRDHGISLEDLSLKPKLPAPICAHCISPGATKTCSRCKSVMYCSRTCQKSDWKNRHKSRCTEVMEAPQAVISGSAVVQAALGLSWSSDIDIFCCWAAAPKLRAKLVTAGKLVFGGISEGGYNNGTKLLEAQLHHVENYILASDMDVYDYFSDEQLDDETRADTQYEQAIEYGEMLKIDGSTCNEWGRRPFGGSTGSVLSPGSVVDPPATPFPYNFHAVNGSRDGESGWGGGEGVQIVVAKPGRTDVRCLLTR